MKSAVVPPVAAVAACLLACTPTPMQVEAEAGGGDSGSGTTASTTPPLPTATSPTNGMTSGMSGDTSTTNTTVATSATTGPDDTTGAPLGECCQAHDGPACDDPAVTDCVCALEASCCAAQWTEPCVELAAGMCDAACDEPGTTDGGGESSSGGKSDACTEVVTFEMLPGEATITGDWQLSMSGLGEGEIAILPNPELGATAGSVLFEPEIPCDDTWTIWVRGLDLAGNDSYYVTLDGMPMPPAIFEAECSDFGMGYLWARLNWRDEADPVCTYLEDPWRPDWTLGVHQIDFSFYEINAIGRILITNDPAFMP